MRRPAGSLTRSLVLTLALVAPLAGACSTKKEPPPPPRTPEQQRKIDSTIGASKLPGAPGVAGALKAQDSAKARQAQLDSIANGTKTP